MKTIVKILVLITISIFIFSACNNAGKEKDVINIGAILPLTGDAAFIGQSIKNGIELAEFENQKYIKVIYEDCQADPKKAVSAYQKLKTQGVNVYIPAFTGVTIAIASLSQDTSDVLCATAVSATNITLKSENLYRLFIHADGDADLIASYAFDSLHFRNMGVIYMNDDFGNAYLQVFKNQFLKEGGKIVVELPFDKTESEFKNLMLKAKSIKNCDAFYILGYDKNLIQILRNYITQNIKKPILSIATIGQKNIRQEIGTSFDLLPNIYYTNTTFSSGKINSEKKTSFISSYAKKYGKEPDYFAAFAYDLTGIIAEAYKNKINLKNYLNNNKYNGVLGEISFSNLRDANIKMYIEKLD